ncbi:unnamed protein product [Rotaria sp. Silwood2]|nr:unnamed protein product [Rotaria sp. Silwood2]CAF3022499.1 unnamed protein product [Rotaria sp. Silwood2]CAF4057153.1 unnamed protein product [Rotaria sp. Silwood2]CAF4419350.1 unnamed protein product [Rotaria sp. Silwood2]
MAVSYFTIFVSFTLILSTFAASLTAPFKQCSPPSSGEVIKVSVNAPCTEEYCTFYKGTDARLEFTFNLKKKAHKVRAKVVATIGTIDHDFALPNSDVCEQLGCPIKNGVEYTYQNSMYVSPTYPSVKVNQMRYYLIDDSATEYRERFMSPRREDYHPHVALPKIDSIRSPLSRSCLSLNTDPDTTSTSSEYRICFANHHPKRPYVFHAQPSHVFDYVPMPINSKSTSRLSANRSVLKDTEYQERYPNYPSFIPVHALIPPHLPNKPNTLSDTQQKRDRMARSQYFHQLVADSDNLNGGQRSFVTSEQRTAFQWPRRFSQSQQKTKQREASTPVYPPYYTPRNIYEPLPTLQRTIVNGFN